MRYNRVHIESIGYELAPVVVSTAELESRLAPVYDAMGMKPGQLELLTGISERRWWEPEYPLSDGAAAAGRKALDAADIDPSEIDVLIYAGVCRENFEPATACAVAHKLNINPGAAVYDVSNACLGVLNGVVDVANRIELGQARAGLVVSAETAREINEHTIDRMLRTKSRELFVESVTGPRVAGAGRLAADQLEHPEPVHLHPPGRQQGRSHRLEHPAHRTRVGDRVERVRRGHGCHRIVCFARKSRMSGIASSPASSSR